MTSRELKNLYFNFFRSKGHAIIPSASLVPENDPTVLFTTAGMHPLVPYLMGEKHPQGTRLANAQKCLRTGDIDDVGDGTHLTFFEMLGAWSLGDYFKESIIPWTFEFFTAVLKMDPHRLYVTVFKGDNTVPRDDESIRFWQELFTKAGIEATLSTAAQPDINDGSRIYQYGKEKNWWGPAGETGPCGPDTEVFYDTGKEHDTAFGTVCHPNCDCGRFVEIGNDVFMEFNKQRDGSFTPLTQKNVDIGWGLERLVATLSGVASVYEIDTVESLITTIRTSARLATGNERSIRIIADHMRAVVFLLADGVVPSNTDQGYVLRRLIRRAIRHAQMIGLSFDTLGDLAQSVIHEYHYHYPELARNRDTIVSELAKEKEKFLKTLEQGMKAFEKLAAQGAISGAETFTLFSSYGFPLEMVQELAREKNIAVDVAGFQEHLAAHQEKSRTASAGKFKGGLADHSDQTVKYHTANHLMLEAMKRILGRDAVNQRGSNITPERLRFDFTYPEKISDADLRRIEELVNGEIQKNHEVRFEEMPVAEAKKLGATGVFDHKYGDVVKVYFVGDFSREICGGPHVTNTKGMGRLRITKEEGVSAGVRRVKAILEND